MKRQNTEGLTLEFLEKKYQEEKQILLKENKRLKKNLEEEIQRADLLKIKTDQLQRENQNLNAIIIELKNEIEANREDSAKQVHSELMIEYQDTVSKYKAALAEKGQLETLIEQIYNQKIDLEREVQQFKVNEQELQTEMQKLGQKHSQFKSQSTQQIQELLSVNKGLEENFQRANIKSSQQRKKTKELQRKMIELQRRLQMSDELQEKKNQEQLQQLRMERDKHYQRSVELNTKCSLYESKISQLEKHQEHLEDQIKSADKKAQIEVDKNCEIRARMEKQQKIIQQLQEQIYKLRQEHKQLQNQKNTIPKQDFMRQMRKNLTDINQLSHKNLMRMGQGATLRDYPSQSQFGVFIKQDDGLQKAKLQAQINTLEADLLSSKKQIDILTDELRKNKRQYEDKQHDLQRKDHEVRQLRLKLEKQIERGKQLLALRKENQNLRGKQTQLMERAKQTAEYETSMSLKLAFYERKIKQNLDNIDRKESIIEKHKAALGQLEEREKHYIQTLKRLNDEVQSLRGYKQECNRKDSILKEYKAKSQKLKDEKQDLVKQVAKLKSDISKLRSDKQRFQTQLQIKEKQLSSLKIKHEKLSSEKTEQYYKQNTRLKQNKNANDHKIKQLRRQKEQLSDALSQIRSIIISKVQEYIAKQIPTGRKKGHQYEAAKLLGLKAGDLEEFLNPGASMNRRITVELEEYWMQGNFVEFTNCFVNYVLAQVEKKEAQS